MPSTSRSVSDSRCRPRLRLTHDARGLRGDIWYRRQQYNALYYTYYVRGRCVPGLLHDAVSPRLFYYFDSAHPDGRRSRDFAGSKRFIYVRSPPRIAGKFECTSRPYSVRPRTVNRHAGGWLPHSFPELLMSFADFADRETR